LLSDAPLYQNVSHIDKLEDGSATKRSSAKKKMKKQEIIGVISLEQKKDKSWRNCCGNCNSNTI